MSGRRLDCQSLDDEVTTLQTPWTWWTHLNGVEDNEYWRSALSVSEITEMDRACDVETEAIRFSSFELQNGSNQQHTCKHDMQCII